MGKALRIGVILAVVVVIAAGIAVWAVSLAGPGDKEIPEKVLVMGTGPDSQGVEVLAFAFVLERGGSSPKLLDTMRPVTVPGATADNAREAFPFVGESGTAKLLGDQTGGTTLPWVSLPPKTWSRLVDQSGGVEVSVTVGTSAYTRGALTLVEPGRQHLSGRMALALASATEYLPETTRAQEVRTLGEAVAELIADKGKGIPALAEERKATSSLSATQLLGFFESK
jgi:hypothetical protein